MNRGPILDEKILVSDSQHAAGGRAGSESQIEGQIGARIGDPRTMNSMRANAPEVRTMSMPWIRVTDALINASGSASAGLHGHGVSGARP